MGVSFPGHNGNRPVHASQYIHGRSSVTPNVLGAVVTLVRRERPLSASSVYTLCSSLALCQREQKIELPRRLALPS